MLRGFAANDWKKAGALRHQRTSRIGWHGRGTAVQIAEAFESAHEKNVVHRDLKPANVKIPALCMDCDCCRSFVCCCVCWFGIRHCWEVPPPAPDEMRLEIR